MKEIASDRDMKDKASISNYETKIIRLMHEYDNEKFWNFICNLADEVKRRDKYE